MDEEIDVTDLINEQVIESPMDLLHKLAIAEENYYKEKEIYRQEYNQHLLNTDWDGVNSERVSKGLPKLGNQDMKKAYIEMQMITFKSDRLLAELEYNRLLRMYEMMKKYSLDVLR